MINYLRAAALATALLSAFSATAAEDRSAPVVVPVGSATLRVIEIGVPATQSSSAGPCVIGGAAAPASPSCTK